MTKQKAKFVCMHCGKVKQLAYNQKLVDWIYKDSVRVYCSWACLQEARHLKKEKKKAVDAPTPTA